MWLENKTPRILATLGLALTAAILFGYAERAVPGKSAVNGTYYNKCCGEVVMRDGQLLYKNALYKYDLKNMKFGLAAYVQGDFTERGIAPSPDETAFLFSAKDGKRAFGTVMRGQEYLFLKTE